MSALSVTNFRPFLRRLAQKDLGFAPAPSASLLPLLTAATLGKGGEWLQPCVEVGFELLSPDSASSAPRPALLAGDEPHSPRRFLVAQVKEAITKSAILIGVPRSIELAVKLGDFLDEEDLGKPFVRQPLEEEGAHVADLGQNGLAGLRTVYKENLDDIFANFSRLGLEDIRESRGPFSRTCSPQDASLRSIFISQGTDALPAHRLHVSVHNLRHIPHPEQSRSRRSPGPACRRPATTFHRHPLDSCSATDGAGDSLAPPRCHTTRMDSRRSREDTERDRKGGCGMRCRRHWEGNAAGERRRAATRGEEQVTCRSCPRSGVWASP